jgi:2-amino-4-hydroxy-6-hydroxymethyldihydropteridine diphosphokinase
MIIISLGSNVTSWWGTPPNTILHALHELDEIGIDVVRRSELYRTAPYGITDQPFFVNAAAVIRTALTPAALLSVLKKIEAKAGRKVAQRWGPRALDIDIVDYNARILKYPKNKSQLHKGARLPLILPHPGIQSRPFVLRPMLDIAPYWHHPISGKGVGELLTKLHFRDGGKILEML